MFLALPGFLAVFGALLIRKRPVEVAKDVLINTSVLPRPQVVYIRSQWPYTDANDPEAPISELSLINSFVTLPDGSSNALDLLSFEAKSRADSLRFTFRSSSSIQIKPASTDIYSRLILIGDDSLNVNWTTNKDGDIQTFDKRLSRDRLKMPPLYELVGPITISSTLDVIALARMWSVEDGFENE
jgi:hypothetical protein